MQTINLDQLSCDGRAYLMDGIPFSGFAIETFRDGTLRTQMSLMHGRGDGVTRRWHPNGQLESEKSFRDGKPHGRHREWLADGTLKSQSSWNAGERIHARDGHGILASADSAAYGAGITHYRFDALGRLSCITVEPDAPSSVHVIEMVTLDKPTDEPQNDE